jgi:glucose-1-phosphatase
MPPQFIYFDLGNVILHFDHQVACRQMAAVAGTTSEAVWTAVFASGLELRYESGELDDQGFYDAFCQATDTAADFDRLRLAGSEIFKLNQSIVPVIAQLDAAGYRLGILSNTCSAHWAYCMAGRFGVLDLAFDVFALSFQIGCCKPDPKIYAAAAELAGVAPRDILYFDDLNENVAGARQAGFDAVPYTTTGALVEDLLARGIRFNY